MDAFLTNAELVVINFSISLFWVLLVVLVALAFFSLIDNRD
ncbi:MAG: hypothetical protein AAB362_01805 [Patescibacteria group bacterium]